MNDSSIDKIKQAESEARKLIEKTGQKAEKMAKDAETAGKNSFENVQNQVTSQINELIEDAKKSIQGLKTQKERELENSLSKLNSIDKSAINAAARVVVKQITTK